MKKKIILLLPVLTLLSFVMIGSDPYTNSYVRDKTIFVELSDKYGVNEENRTIVQQEFISNLDNTIGYNYRILNNYKAAANILELSINSADYETIANLSAVENISESKTYKPNLESSSYNPYGSKATAPDKNYSAIDMNAVNQSKNGQKTMVAILDDSFNVDHEMFKNIYTDLRYTKSELASIMTGSSFKGKSAAYKDNKIPFYYSYGTQNTNMNFTGNSVFHGTHVAGIVGANNTFNGIVPNAQLALMKVTNSSGDFTDSAILNALNDCALLKVDSINMSFGNAILDFEITSSYQSIFDKLENLGVSTNCAAGNDSRESFDLLPYQNLTTSNVETGLLGQNASPNSVTTVGALNITGDLTIKTSFATKSGTPFRVRDNIVDHDFVEDTTNKEQYYDDIMPFYEFVKDGETSATLDYEVVPNLGNEADYSGIDVNGKIALISRGSLSFVEKIRNAVKHGASGVLIYNNVGATDQVGYFNLAGLETKYYRPAGYISSTDGELLKNQSIKQIVVAKEMSADYSSDGSTTNLSLKPDISAPGTQVYSGIGLNSSIKKYAYYDGTSMATPNYSGALAYALSNKTFSDENARDAYKLSLTMRAMSSANVLFEPNGAPYSPRKVGAGEVDCAGIINSDVYLEGNVAGKAKIELKNNSEIASGKVNLDVKTHNDSSSTKNYKATLYVCAPALTSVDNIFGNLSKTVYQNEKDVLLKTSVSNVSIPAGESSLNFSTTIDESNKEYLKNFENGTYLEGYVVLTSLSGEEDLSIPYMGFYGDYSTESAVEPFSFEKDTSKIYSSDLLNNLASLRGFSNANYSSDIFVSGSALTSTQIDTVIKNKAGFNNYANIAKYSADNSLLLGVSGVSTNFVIQQYINRNIIDNQISLVQDSTGKTVLTDAMFSTLNSNKYETKHAILRSLATPSLISSGYFADRGYTEISLVDNTGKLLYEEGRYTLNFTYQLASGYTQVKSYKVVIGSVDETTPPSFLNREFVTYGNKKYLRIRFDDASTNCVVNSTNMTIESDYNGKYVDLGLVEYKNQVVKLDISDKFDNHNYALISFEDNGQYFEVNSTSFKDATNFQVEKKIVDTNSFSYKISVFDSNYSTIDLSTGYDLLFNFDTSFTMSKNNLQIFDLNGDSTLGNEKSFSLYNGTVKVTTTSSQIRAIYSGNTSIPDSGDDIGFNIGIIIGGIALIIGGIVAAFVIISFNKRKH